jgi:hypothetical protein
LTATGAIAAPFAATGATFRFFFTASIVGAPADAIT